MILAPHPMLPLFRGVAEGLLPRQVLAGADAVSHFGHLQLADPSDSFVDELLRQTWQRWHLGPSDPRQMWRALVAASKTKSFVFSMWERSLGGRARSFVRLRPPTVTLVHDTDPFEGIGAVCDGAVCLTQRAAEKLSVAGVAAVYAPWGPDLDFSGYRCDEPEDYSIVSIGRTGRDFTTLLYALEATNLPAIVDSPGASGLPDGTRSLAEVARLSGARSSGGRYVAQSYDRPMSAFSSASVFVIPLDRPFDTPVGLSELNDAVALGRPVIMTRSPGLGIDIEREGFGIWVDPKDPVGLAAALDRLRDDATRAELGHNARVFAEKKWNYEFFKKGLGELLRSCGIAESASRNV